MATQPVTQEQLSELLEKFSKPKLADCYRSRPLPLKGFKGQDGDKNFDERGRHIPDPKPHPDLLASPRPLSIDEQVRRLERISALDRLSYLDSLEPDDFGDDVIDIVDGDPLSPSELAAMRLPEPPDEQQAEPPVSGREEPTEQPKTA